MFGTIGSGAGTVKIKAEKNLFVRLDFVREYA